MILQALASALVLSSTAKLASAQTYSSCNPIRQSGCPADTALSNYFVHNFGSGASDSFQAVQAPSQVSYGGNGAAFTIAKSGDNPTIQSNFYIMFGRVEVELKASPGQGIVSSLVLESDDLDEIDLEWLGTDTTQVESNFFSKGATPTFDRAQYHGVESPQTLFHNYTIDWTVDLLNWYIDGTLVRSLSSASVQQDYPQTPLSIKVGSWAGGDPSNAPGTIEWAGGATNYADGPFVFNVGRIAVTDYSTGSSYYYADQSGSWTSIRSNGGRINGNAPH